MDSFKRPGTQHQSSFGISFDVDRDATHASSFIPPPLHSTSERLSIDEQRRRLPIYQHRTEILYLVQNTATTIIVGETGSGKSTQIPQYLKEAGWTSTGQMIACTQPRRVAAISIAARTAEEIGCRLGEDVGYAIRFEDVSTPGKTTIRFCTDGVLLKEMMEDPLLLKYSVIIVDEAHERSLATDILLGLLKKVQKKRRDLRLVISSATMQAQEIADFFHSPITIINANANRDNTKNTSSVNHHHRVESNNKKSIQLPTQSTSILSVQGRVHAVQIHYLQHPCSDYITTAVQAVMDIHNEDMPGDILVFMPGQEECEHTVSLLMEEERKNNESMSMKKKNHSYYQGGSTTTTRRKLHAVAFYAGLSAEAQQAAIASSSISSSSSSSSSTSNNKKKKSTIVRKVVVATTIAETSITIEGIVYVVDCMFSKQRFFDPVHGVESLVTAPISTASAVQRAGRAGRIRPGHAFRLCTESDFEKELRSVDVPEVQRCDLSGIVVQLKSLGIDNLMSFDWLAPPPAEAMIRALETLHALRALDDDAKLSHPLGTRMAELPVDPFLSSMLLESTKTGCALEIATVVAMLSVQSVWAHGNRSSLAQARLKFAASQGDLITYLNIWRAWVESGKNKRWAVAHYISHRAMLRAADIRDQLLAYLRRMKLPIKSAFAGVSSMGSDAEEALKVVCKALTAGLFLNAVKIAPENAVGHYHQQQGGVGGAGGGGQYYELIRGSSSAKEILSGDSNGNDSSVKLRIHHSSVLFRHKMPSWLCFYAAQQSERGFYDMQDVLVIDPGWLMEVAPHYFTQVSANPQQLRPF